jgi:type III restriction enzyme
MRTENRNNLLVRKQNPTNYLDILSIIEHPAYRTFYDDLLGDAFGVDTGDLSDDPDRVLGDLETV